MLTQAIQLSGNSQCYMRVGKFVSVLQYDSKVKK